MGISDEIRIRNLSYCKPDLTRTQVEMGSLRDSAKIFSETIAGLCHDSRETVLAHTHLETALMWAIADLARNEPKESE